MDLHWNFGAKTATATVELLERQIINIKPHGKYPTISVHLKRSENHKKGRYTVQQHFYGKIVWLPCASSREDVVLSACYDM
ncbi:hypothetical protein BDR06DRAFT_66134 [Suillus hirtellus]|nr:hypothetical protein BDR06DRAFT_66134 [Suillus hirtellus]